MLAATLLLAGCESVVEVDFPAYEPELVVYGLFSPDRPWEVYVSRSAPLGERASPGLGFISNATVEILEGESVVARLQHRREGQYDTDASYPEAGKRYTLRVSAPGYPTVTATDRVPMAPAVSGVRFVDSLHVDGAGRAEAELHFRIADPAGGRDFYELRVWYDVGAGPVAVPFRTNDPILREESFQEIIREGVEIRSYSMSRFDDALFDGRTYATVVRLDRYEANRYGLRVDALSETYYRYQESRALIEENEDNPFAEPAPLYSNVEGGLGVFAGFVRTDVVAVHLDEDCP